MLLSIPLVGLAEAAMMENFFKSGLSVKTKKKLFQTLPDDLKKKGPNELNLLVE